MQQHADREDKTTFVQNLRPAVCECTHLCFCLPCQNIIISSDCNYNKKEFCNFLRKVNPLEVAEMERGRA
jgi:hypothetical protein